VLASGTSIRRVGQGLDSAFHLLIFITVLSLSSKFSLRIAQRYNRYIFLEKKRSDLTNRSCVPVYGISVYESL